MRGESDSLQLLKGNQSGHGKLSLGKILSCVCLYLKNLKVKTGRGRQGRLYLGAHRLNDRRFQLDPTFYL